MVTKFKVGDYVINNIGRVGRVIDIMTATDLIHYPIVVRWELDDEKGPPDDSFTETGEYDTLHPQNVLNIQPYTRKKLVLKW